MKLGTVLESTNALYRTRESSGPRDAKPVQLLCSRDATCSRLSIVRFDTGPKRSMGHLLGGEKGIFLIRGSSAAKGESRAVAWTRRADELDLRLEGLRKHLAGSTNRTEPIPP